MPSLISVPLIIDHVAADHCEASLVKFAVYSTVPGVLATGTVVGVAVADVSGVDVAEVPGVVVKEVAGVV